MLGKFSLDTMMRHGGMPAALFLIIYLFTMIVMIMNFFVAVLNDFLAAVANDEKLQNRDFEVMDHFVDTVRELVMSNNDNNGLVNQNLSYLLAGTVADLIYGHLFFLSNREMTVTGKTASFSAGFSTLSTPPENLS